MNFPVQADIMGLFQGLIAAIRPFAEAHQIKLSFASDVHSLEANYHPESMISILNQLICRIITFTPQNHDVWVRVRYKDQDPCIQVEIQNSGVNLALMGDIRTGLDTDLQVLALTNGTIFRMQIRRNSPIDNRHSLGAPGVMRHMIRPWYAEIRKRLTNHFSNPEKLVELAKMRNKHEGIFLQKVNLIIDSHLENEGFNTEHLGRYMALSRTQLFRKIKNLTQKAPGQYIRYIRLKKAREFLQKGDLNVSEVASRVGFVSNSHFTRAFQKQFGMNPSQIKHE